MKVKGGHKREKKKVDKLYLIGVELNLRKPDCNDKIEGKKEVWTLW